MRSKVKKKLEEYKAFHEHKTQQYKPGVMTRYFNGFIERAGLLEDYIERYGKSGLSKTILNEDSGIVFKLIYNVHTGSPIREDIIYLGSSHIPQITEEFGLENDIPDREKIRKLECHGIFGGIQLVNRGIKTVSFKGYMRIKKVII